ncbi:hypothetical protein [Hyphobacterium sp.]|uniref:hypothetical protein n=1 Tax=Hyphobacterium sp. TaxID=2004662 RepID=UPI00374A9778
MNFALALLALAAPPDFESQSQQIAAIIETCADRVALLREDEVDFVDSELNLSFSNGAELIYIGAAHTNDPDDPQLIAIQSAIEDDQPDIVLHEGYSWPNTANLREAVQRYFEPGYTQSLASSLGIPTGTLEPSEPDLWAEVLNKISALDYQMYLITRRVRGWVRQRINGTQLTERSDRYISSLQSRGEAWGWPMPIAAFDEYQEHFQDVWPGLEFSQIPGDWFNPMLDGSQTGGRLINEANRVESNIRNVAMFRRISSLIADGETIVAVVGRNHVFQQAPAFQCLQDAIANAAIDNVSSRMPIKSVN